MEWNEKQKMEWNEKIYELTTYLLTYANINLLQIQRKQVHLNVIDNIQLA